MSTNAQNPETYLRELLLTTEADAHSGIVLTYNEKVDRLYLSLAAMEQTDTRTKHYIDRGLYCREATVEAGTLLISKTHLHPHHFIMSRGIIYMIDERGEVKRLEGHNHGITPGNTRRVVYVEEEVVFTTLHPTDLTDIDQIEASLYAEDRLLISDNPDHQDFRAMAKDIGMTEEQIRIESYRTDTTIPMPEGAGLKTKVQRSPIDGLGMFSTEAIAAFELIAPASIDRMRTPAGRYTNHSANPNAMLHVPKRGLVNLVSIEAIPAGTEITLDYRQARSASIEAYLLDNKS